MKEDTADSTLNRAYSGESDGVIVVRTRYDQTEVIILFKANLPLTWSEEERLTRLDAVMPLIEAAASRDFRVGRFTNLRTLSDQLEDAALIILGWGDLG